MMLEIQQEHDYEDPSSNAESEDENDLSEDWIQTYQKNPFQCLICDFRFAEKDDNWDT